MEKKVVIPRTHQNEWKSQRALEEILNPWTIMGNWNAKDYGIDGVFTINDEIANSKDACPTGLNFLVQLKSTSKLKVKNGCAKFVVEVRKIHQWHQNNLPVLLTIFILEEEHFLYCWIDTNLINLLNKKKANWTTQEKITIEIPVSNTFTGDFKKTLKTYIKTIFPAQLNKSKPGLYFDLKAKTTILAGKFQSTVENFSFESPVLRAKQLQEDLELTIYRVAVAGPSRVGKSSLINALVGRKEISPTGIYQTTGVPIQIISGREEKIEVYFQDKEKQTIAYNSTTVKDYASQAKECNPRNNKKVTLVSIQILNQQLDKGVCYYDLPGLDDPDDVIVGYSRDTLKNANAIIYVIDGSNASTGGYSFRAEYKRDLLAFAKENQKLFFVLNKVNSLTPAIKQSLRERVIEDLIEHDLYDKVNERVFFVSAEDALFDRVNDNTNLSFGEFEEDLWSFIISNNKYGIYKLNEVLKKLFDASNDFEGILNTRKMNASKSSELSNAIATIQTKIPNLQSIFNKQMKSISDTVHGKLNFKAQQGLTILRQNLTKWPAHLDLPKSKYLNDYITQNAIIAIEAANIDLQDGAKRLQDILDNWISDNVQVLRDIAYGEAERQNIDFSELQNIKPPDVDIAQSLGIGLASSLIMFLVNPYFAVATFFLAAFGSWILSAESRRAKEIDNIMQQATYNYNRFLSNCSKQYNVALDAYSHKMAAYVNSQLQTYITDLQKQIAECGTPLSANEHLKYVTTFKELGILRTEIDELKEEVQICYHQV